MIYAFDKSLMFEFQTVSVSDYAKVCDELKVDRELTFVECRAIAVTKDPTKLVQTIARFNELRNKKVRSFSGSSAVLPQLTVRAQPFYCSINCQF